MSTEEKTHKFCNKWRCLWQFRQDRYLPFLSWSDKVTTLVQAAMSVFQTQPYSKVEQNASTSHPNPSCSLQRMSVGECCEDIGLPFSLQTPWAKWSPALRAVHLKYGDPKSSHFNSGSSDSVPEKQFRKVKTFGLAPPSTNSASRIWESPREDYPWPISKSEDHCDFHVQLISVLTMALTTINTRQKLQN